jgi:hypothetical protein
MHRKVHSQIFCSMEVLFVQLKRCVAGAIYKDDCPREHFIPIYLIVGGSVASVLQLVTTVHMIVAKCKDNVETSIMTVIMTIFYVTVGLFILAWFIAGEQSCDSVTC